MGHTPTDTHPWIYTHIHVHTCIYMHTQIYIHMHTHTHTITILAEVFGKKKGINGPKKGTRERVMENDYDQNR